MTQIEILKKHFEIRKSITNVEAHSMRIRSVSRRINDLEDIGYVFHRERRKDSLGQPFVRYHFLGKEERATTHLVEAARPVDTGGI